MKSLWRTLPLGRYSFMQQGRSLLLLKGETIVWSLEEWVENLVARNA